MERHCAGERIENIKTCLRTFLWMTAAATVLSGWPLRLQAADPVPATNQAAAACSGELAELLKALSGTTNVLADFVQEKQMSIMREKVVIRGRMAFQQPDLFAWHVASPIRYNLVLRGATLSQWDEATGKKQDMAMASNPVFEMLNRQLRAWYGGQFDALLKDFDAGLDSSAAGRVIFVPRMDSFARKAIKSVVLTFREDRRYLESIRIEELSGDRTLMTFSNTVVNCPINPALWEVKPHGR